jgi:hypothetical protein
MMKGPPYARIFLVFCQEILKLIFKDGLSKIHYQLDVIKLTTIKKNIGYASRRLVQIPFESRSIKMSDCGMNGR